MTSLLDIGPLTKKVKVRDQEIEVSGISGKVLFNLLDQFPALKNALSGTNVEVKPADLLKQVPDAVSSIIAAAVGMMGNADVIKKADELTIGEQADVLTVIWELTFPQGVQSFTAALEALGLNITSGWDQATASPEPLNSLSPAVIHPEKSGTTPQG